MRPVGEVREELHLGEGRTNQNFIAPRSWRFFDVVGGWGGVGWSGVEWGGVGWSGVEWGGVGWSGVEWGGVGWSGVEWGGVGWSGVEWGGVGWGGVGCSAGQVL